MKAFLSEEIYDLISMPVKKIVDYLHFYFLLYFFRKVQDVMANTILNFDFSHPKFWYFINLYFWTFIEICLNLFTLMWKWSVYF